MVKIILECFPKQHFLYTKDKKSVPRAILVDLESS